jgi:hypothetical protein
MLGQALVGCKIMAGHVAGPAKLVPFGHGEEGEGDIVVDRFSALAESP